MKKEYTVKEIADLLEVSKTTVSNSIKEMGIQYDVFKNNKHIYFLEKTEIIIKNIKSDFDFSSLRTSKKLENSFANSKSADAQTQTENANSHIKTEKDYENSQISKLIDMLQEELKAKDKQIEMLYQLLENEQKMNAMRIEKKEEPTEEEPPAEKKSFLKKLFSK